VTTGLESEAYMNSIGTNAVYCLRD